MSLVAVLAEAVQHCDRLRSVLAHERQSYALLNISSGVEDEIVLKSGFNR